MMEKVERTRVIDQIRTMAFGKFSNADRYIYEPEIRIQALRALLEADDRGLDRAYRAETDQHSEAVRLGHER
jgi:hypothetical protein